jgi:hypothetical protein
MHHPNNDNKLIIKQLST